MPVRVSEIDALSLKLMEFLQRRKIVHLELPVPPKVVIFRSKRPMLLDKAHAKKTRIGAALTLGWKLYL
jgi:hypothetical protein